MKLKYVCFFILIAMGYSSRALAQIVSNLPGDTVEIYDPTQHRPGSGFVLFNNNKVGKVTLSFTISMRYLNQLGLDSTRTDAFGRTFPIDRRNDFFFQKSSIYLRGWMMDPRFRYVVFVWTSNTNMGLGAQVVVAGNLQYQLSKHLDIGGGVGPLPTNRSTYGQYPEWLRNDARPIGDEFFRGSFTFGVWVQGQIIDGLSYKSMLANNLSQLGVDAGQLDNKFNTWSTALWYTSKDYGRIAPYGDLENHQKPAWVLGGSYTSSTEDAQSQPDANAPENTQIRLSDGTGLFSINAFNNGSQVKSAFYQMSSFHSGIKYKGFSLDGEYFMRWVSNFKTTGPIPVKNLFDNGFTVQTSAMLIPRSLQIYGIGSYINGQYGKPSEIIAGLNWFITKTKTLRLNPEVMFENHSPVGYLAYPVVVGAKGTIFMLNLELWY